MPARVATEWSAQDAVRTIVELTPRTPLGRTAAHGAEARTLHDRIAEGGTLTFEPAALRLVLPAPWLDGEALLARLRQMRQLHDLVHAGAGPYR